MSRLTVTDSGSATHTGNVRRSNEDAHLVRDPLFMVADGVGGARAGEIAARLCAEAFAQVELSGRSGEELLVDVIRRANRAIFDRAHSDHEAAGMGTTVAAAVLAQPPELALAHVGDSRAYLLRDGVLQRLSEDHSLVSELVQSGQLTEAEAEHHPQRNVVTRVLGTEPDVQVDSFTVEAQEDDLVLLCTDGLNTMVPEAQIAEQLAQPLPAAELARRLVQAARRGGGEDNVTAVVFRMGLVTDELAHGASATERRLPALPHPDAPPPSGRSGRMRSALGIVAVGVLVAALAVASVVGLAAANFVGADTATGRVAIYQGVPVDLPFGLHLYRLRYQSSVSYALLPAATRTGLFDQRLRSSASAYAAVHALEATYP
jgi:protein phosphatase